MTQLSPAEIMTELAALKKLFTAAQEDLGKGSITSMAGIDKRIGQICQTVQQAPAIEQEKYLPELTMLIDLLNKYEMGLREFQVAQLAAAANIAAKDEQS